MDWLHPLNCEFEDKDVCVYILAKCPISRQEHIKKHFVKYERADLLQAKLRTIRRAPHEI